MPTPSLQTNGEQSDTANPYAWNVGTENAASRRRNLREHSTIAKQISVAVTRQGFQMCNVPALAHSVPILRVDGIGLGKPVDPDE